MSSDFWYKRCNNQKFTFHKKKQEAATSLQNWEIGTCSIKKFYFCSPQFLFNLSTLTKISSPIVLGLHLPHSGHWRWGFRWKENLFYWMIFKPWYNWDTTYIRNIDRPYWVGQVRVTGPVTRTHSPLLEHSATAEALLLLNWNGIHHHFKYLTPPTMWLKTKNQIIHCNILKDEEKKMIRLLVMMFFPWNWYAALWKKYLYSYKLAPCKCL